MTPPPRLVPDRPSDARSEAYDIIDNFLRNVLMDAAYAEYSEALDLIYAAAPPAEAPGDSPADYLFWTDGAPHRILSAEDGEWFIAQMVNGDRLVLRSLPEEWAHDFTTADGTYIKAASIKRWMQFPDSEYKPLGLAAAPAAPAAEYRAATDEEEAAIDKAVGLVKVVLRFPTLLHCTLTAEAEERGIAFPALIREKLTAPRVTGGRDWTLPMMCGCMDEAQRRLCCMRDKCSRAYALQAATGGEG